MNGWRATPFFFIPENNNKGNLATGYRGGCTLMQQLDYILIEHRYRNWAEIKNDTLSNTSPLMRRRTITLEL